MKSYTKTITMKTQKSNMGYAVAAMALALSLASCEKNELGSCNDGKLNQNETAIDCGGVCGACEEEAAALEVKQASQDANVQSIAQAQETVQVLFVHEGDPFKTILIGQPGSNSSKAQLREVFIEDPIYGKSYGVVLNNNGNISSVFMQKYDGGIFGGNDYQLTGANGHTVSAPSFSPADLQKMLEEAQNRSVSEADLTNLAGQFKRVLSALDMFLQDNEVIEIDAQASGSVSNTNNERIMLFALDYGQRTLQALENQINEGIEGQHNGNAGVSLGSDENQAQPGSSIAGSFNSTTSASTASSMILSGKSIKGQFNNDLSVATSDDKNTAVGNSGSTKGQIDTTK